MDPKDVYCRRFLLQKACKWGQSCKFLHKPLPNNLCKYYTFMGTCNHGKQCKFVHQKFRPPRPDPDTEESADAPPEAPIAAPPADSKSNGVGQSQSQSQTKSQSPTASGGQSRGTGQEEVKKKPAGPTTRTLFVKQGLRPEEKARFQANAEEWKGHKTYPDYVKALIHDVDRDVAQVIRKYQYSFHRLDAGDPNVVAFSLKHT
jgi:hypothetical protein